MCARWENCFTAAATGIFLKRNFFPLFTSYSSDLGACRWWPLTHSVCLSPLPPDTQYTTPTTSSLNFPSSSRNFHPGWKQTPFLSFSAAWNRLVPQGNAPRLRAEIFGLQNFPPIFFQTKLCVCVLVLSLGEDDGVRV